ncbi:MAG: Ig-like domain-containing protein [Myxococcales bacterium]|nr:Ig-like domain-containing protein [Myxococcales bacterium]
MKRLIHLFLGATLLVGLALGLAGCGDELEPLEAPADNDAFRVLMTNPHHEMFNVPLTSSVLIYLSHEIDPPTVAGHVLLTDAAGNQPEVTTEIYDASIVLTPTSNWEELTDYTLHILPGIRDKSGRTMNEEKFYTFQSGIRRPKAAEQLSVRRVVPGDEDPCWDFMTFRVFFNEPVERDTVRYGESVLFEDVDTGEQLPGNTFARASQLVFDPDADLVAGHKYRLTITNQLTDVQGSRLAEPFVHEWTAVSTGKHTKLAMDYCPTALGGYGFCAALPDDESYPQSRMLPRRANSVYTKSVFLGDTDMMVGGRLWNEFGDAKLSPKRVPFVVRKGQKLIGKELQYKVGGEINSGIYTGNIYITLLTDAVGEMIGSEFVSGEAGLPATITLMMDSAMSLDDPTANAMLPQPLLGIQMVGLASVAVIDEATGYEAMKIELTGYSELNLGNERMPVIMALQMVPPPTLPEEEILDTTPPEVLSVSPVDMVVEPDDIGNLVDTRMAGDPIIAYFSEPLDPDTVRDHFYVVGPEGKVPGRYDMYHPKMYFEPDEPLDPDTIYRVVVEPGIEDISGNATTERHEYTFKTMPYQGSATEPMRLLATVPTRETNSIMPRNYLPEFYFSQIVDLDSLINGETFMLYDVTAGEMIPGTIESYSIFVDFVPDEEPIAGHLYRWEITEGVTNLDGLALDTDMDGVPGGPPYVVDFTVTPFSPFSQTVQFTYPYADTNANGWLDPEETATKVNTMTMKSPLIHDPAYVLGFFPISAYRLAMNEASEPRLPVAVVPHSYQIGTSVSVSLSLGGKADPPGLLDMGPMLIELQPNSWTDVVQSADNLLQADVNIGMEFNVENSLLNSLLVHDMVMSIPGKMRYTKDGRMMSIVRGRTMAGMSIPILGVMDVPVQVNLISTTVPTTRAY